MMLDSSTLEEDKLEKKQINKDTFQPKTKTCQQCNQKQELKPKDPNTISCKKFGWLINRKLAKIKSGVF